MNKTIGILRVENAFRLVLPAARIFAIFPDKENPREIHGDYGVGSAGYNFKLISWPKHDELILFHGDAVMLEDSEKGKYSAVQLEVMNGGDTFVEQYFDDEDEAWAFADKSRKCFFVNRETGEVKEHEPG